MDIGALIVDPFLPDHVAVLQGALVDMCEQSDLDANRLHVAFSAHPELGNRLVVHLHDNEQGDVHDPHLFFANLELADEPGACLSGTLGERLGEAVRTPTVWTCLFERRGGAWTVYEGFYYTAESEHDAEDPSPFKHLVSALDIQDADLMRAKLELPDTPWMGLTEPFPLSLVEELTSRLPG